MGSVEEQQLLELEDVGVFLAQEYFPGDPLALLPITAYHVVQLAIDTPLAGLLADRRPAAA